MKIVVAANDRVARHLRVDHNLRQRRLGLEAWAMPPIYSLSVWLRNSWASEWPEETLLYPVQELSLWVEAVEASGRFGARETVLVAAREAMSAAAIAERCCIQLGRLQFLSADEEALIEWAKYVDRRLTANRWLPESRIPRVLAERVVDRSWLPEGALELVGFVEPPPNIKALFECLASRDVEVTHREYAGTAPIRRYLHANPIDEVRWVSREISAILAAHRDSPEEAPRIAVLVPDVDSMRGQIERSLSLELNPIDGAPSESLARVPWRFSPGPSLSAHPLAVSALRWCSLRQHRNPTDLLSSLLLGSGGGWSSHSVAMAELDLRLREDPRVHMDLSALLPLIPVSMSDRACLRDAVEALDKMLAAAPDRQLPSEWVKHLRALLDSVGWGAQERSEEFQAMQQVLNSIDLLSALDSQVGRIGHSRVLFFLREMLARPFQAAVPHDQPIEILPYWDAAGIDFDYVFVLQASSDQIPPRPVQFGYLARDRLADSGFALASPEGCTRYAELWFELLRKATNTLIHWSWSSHTESGGESMPSRIDGLPAIRVEDLPPISDVRPVSLESVVEVAAPAWSPVSDKLSGAVRLLADYAVSPAIAFWRHRLGLSQFPVKARGLDARLQGDLIHGALAHFWRELKCSEELRARSADALRQLIRESIVSYVREHSRQFGHLHTRLLEWEVLRAVDSIEALVTAEKARTLPFTVVATEFEATGKLDGLEFTVRLDRVDAIEAGEDVKLLLADYKTGRNNRTAGWNTPRIESPQLPLYASHADLSALAGDIAGVAFFEVAGEQAAIRALTAIEDPGLLATRTRGDDRVFAEMTPKWTADFLESLAGYRAGTLSIEKHAVAGNGFNGDLAVLLRQNPPAAPSQEVSQ